jgi:hypothetical protein
MSTRVEELPDRLDRFDTLLEQLPAADAERVAHGNAERLWFAGSPAVDHHESPGAPRTSRG